jgi:hypothetical protein
VADPINATIEVPAFPSQIKSIAASCHRSALLIFSLHKKWSIVNSFQVSQCAINSKIPWVSLPLIEVPIMSLWRHHQEYSDTAIRDIFLALTQIALVFAAVLLWFFG